jgi:hypothetical protein
VHQLVKKLWLSLSQLSMALNFHGYGIYLLTRTVRDFSSFFRCRRFVWSEILIEFNRLWLCNGLSTGPINQRQKKTFFFCLTSHRDRRNVCWKCHCLERELGYVNVHRSPLTQRVLITRRESDVCCPVRTIWSSPRLAFGLNLPLLGHKPQFT